MIDICLLGCGGMMPLPERNLSAVLFRYQGKMILLDCGEGTQVPMRMTGWGYKSLEAICITHYHADHIAGLPGLLSTVGNSGRLEPLKVFGPPGLEEVVKGLTVIVPYLPFAIETVELSETASSSYHIGDIRLKSISADHTLSCLAYSLELQRAGKFDAIRAESLSLPKPLWGRLQKGGSVEYEGKRYLPKMVLGPPRQGLKIAYCTDTRPSESLVDFCRDSNLLICEGMYGEEEHNRDAIEKKHMTFTEAATLAKGSRVKELWLTHYSPQIKDPDRLTGAARNIFVNTIPGHDLMTKTLVFDE